jgi:NAD(P)-dependent dehydrogenase (short-subunit alcohol dehydrogenase family)
MKTILITGGSKGIGKEIVKEALNKNYKVIFTYYKSAKAARQIEKCSKFCTGVKINLESPKERKKIKKILKEKKVILAGLINNAAFDVKRKRFENIKQSELKRIFEINVFAVYDLIKISLPFFKKNKFWSSIINLSSSAAKFGGVKFTHYAPTKAAIENLTIGLSKELGQKKIRVLSVAPGIIDSKEENKKNKNILKSIPSGRIGKANEVAKLILWLLSEEANYINGSIIPINGGR